MLKHLFAVVLICATVYVVSTASARAADPTAQAFVDTVALGSVAIKDSEAAVRERFEALDLPRCYAAIDSELPDRAVRAFEQIGQYGSLDAVFRPNVASMRAIVAGLDAIPTSDPALRSGRSAWRRTAELAAALPPMAPPCPKIEAWAKRKWRGKAPRIVPAGGEKVLAALDDDVLSGKFERAAKRLRVLGISAKHAEVWSGDTVFDGLFDEIARLVDESAPAGDEPL